VKVHKLTSCPACGAARSEEFRLQPAGHLLRRCLECEMVFAPEFADPDDVYVEGYLTADTDFGLSFVQHPLFQEVLDSIAERRLKILERTTKGPRSILDVGCGSGEFIRGAVRRGWSAKGVEPVEESVAIARSRGLDVTSGLLQDSDIPERSFDVVSAFHVLEHINEGKAFLELISRWAKPGGYVFIEVPNWNSLHRRKTGSNWPGLRPLEHIGHYTPTTLAGAMRRAGLEPIKVSTPSYLTRSSPTKYAVGELGLLRWMSAFERLSKPRPFDGGTELLPGPVAWSVLTLASVVYGGAKTGHALLGIARVP